MGSSSPLDAPTRFASAQFAQSRLHSFSLVTCLLLACLALGCGKTNRKIIEEKTPAFTELRKKLENVVAKLLETASRPVAAVKDGAGLSAIPKLSPTPVYQGDSGNLDILMAKQLTAPDEEPEFDLRLSHSLVVALKWTGPNNPMSDSALSERDTTLAADLDAARDLDYVGVVCVNSLQEPIVAGDRFAGGKLEAERVFSVGAFQATPPETVEFRHEEAENPEAALQRVDSFCRHRPSRALGRSPFCFIEDSFTHHPRGWRASALLSTDVLRLRVLRGDVRPGS